MSIDDNAPRGAFNILLQHHSERREQQTDAQDWFWMDDSAIRDFILWRIEICNGLLYFYCNIYTLYFIIIFFLHTRQSRIVFFLLFLLIELIEQFVVQI